MIDITAESKSYGNKVAECGECGETLEAAAGQTVHCPQCECANVIPGGTVYLSRNAAERAAQSGLWRPGR
jgi:Zn finger protein HypA/HybF involved in hydrogenase expression